MPQRNTNVSLDVPSAQLLNLFDTLGHDSRAREQLVNELLLQIELHGGEQRRFLESDQVQHIVDFYAQSNSELNERYAIAPHAGSSSLFARHQVAPAVQDATPLLSRLAAQMAYSVWDGEELHGEQLHALLVAGGGWSTATAEGVWSLGDKSSIKFRLPMARTFRPTNNIEVCFNGHYFGANGATEVCVAGESVGDLNLQSASIVITPRQLQSISRVEIDLVHHHPQAPSALHGSDDHRLLSFRLVSLSYRAL